MNMSTRVCTSFCLRFDYPNSNSLNPLGPLFSISWLYACIIDIDILILFIQSFVRCGMSDPKEEGIKCKIKWRIADRRWENRRKTSFNIDMWLGR